MANRIKQIQFRLKMRATLHNASIEEITIIKEEIKREYERRAKKKNT